ncbi:MAG: TRAP transporter substrate-binding protein [Oscillospiraceae bacterium]|nr:TRAP transporter substrate-binding protein [Oscillospiraceae bacterium]
MKKVLSVALALALIVVLLAACNGNDNTSSSPPTTSPSSEAPPSTSSTPPPASPPASPPESAPVSDTPPAVVETGNELPWNPANIGTHKFILAHGMPAENVVSKCYHEFCEYVKELSEGKMVIEEMINGSLLKDTETFDGLRDGMTDFIHSMGSYVTGTVKDLSPLTIAGYYGGDNWLDFAFGTKDLVSRIYADSGVKYLGALYQGTSVIACSTKQITQPGDVKGVAFRASGEWVSKTVTAWGGAAQNIALPQLADAFQKGTVEGVATGWTIIGGWGIWEVAKYLTTTDITEGFAALLMNMGVWDSLNADEQALIAHAGELFTYKNYELTQIECQNYYDKVKAEGKNEIYELPAADNQTFVDIAYSLYPEMVESGTLGQKGLQLIDMLKQYNGIS